MIYKVGYPALQPGDECLLSARNMKEARKIQKHYFTKRAKIYKLVEVKE